MDSTPHLHRSMPAWASAALLIVAGCSAAPAETSPGAAGQPRPLSARLLDGGSRSGITISEERVIQGPDEWQRLWQAHHAGAGPSRPGPVGFRRLAGT